MTIEQTIEVPANRQILLDLPFELPIGKARVSVTPLELPEKNTAPSLASLFGIDKDRDTMKAYFERKRAEKLKEDTQFENLRRI